MLSPGELREKSTLWGIPVENVDKDWVLGHVLRAVFTDVGLNKTLVFKGGTCLRKAYFPEYRFSEDLDFTAVQPIHREQIRRSLSRCLAPVYERTGIRFGSVSVEEELYEDRLMGYRALIPFWGAAHPGYRRVPGETRWHTKIKLDISLRERIYLPVAHRPLLHPYPDLSTMEIQMPVYCLEEIFAEKWRSLMQRSYLAPRDCYDLWYLWVHFRDLMDWAQVKQTFLKKCDLKGIRIKDGMVFFSPERIFQTKKGWTPSLGDQLREIPPAEKVVEDLEEALKKILGQRGIYGD